MSKIKMLLDVVQDLRSLTDSLEALAHAIEEPEEKQGDVVRMEPIAESVQPTEPQQATAEIAPCRDALSQSRRWWNCAPSLRPAPRPRHASGFARCWPDTAWLS